LGEVEFRHKSRWRKAVYRAFEKRKLICCSASGPSLPDELVQTADVLYVRFHGLTRWYRHNYSRQERSALVKRIQGSGAKELWANFNNEREGFAIKNAKLLRRLLTAGEPKS
jgi:uncharacterized protein YecE (DUF72 family)